MSTYGNPIQQSGTIPGDATAANQALQLAQETITANETTGIKTDTDLLVTATGAPTDAAQTDPTQTANEIELLKGLLTFILTLGSETDGVPSNPIANTSATIQNVVRLIANNLYVLTNDLVLPYTPITPNGTFGALGQAKDPAVLSAIITSPGEAEDGVHQLALRRGERDVDEREVAAVDEPVAIEQHQAFHGRGHPPGGAPAGCARGDAGRLRRVYRSRTRRTDSWPVGRWRGRDRGHIRPTAGR